MNPNFDINAFLQKAAQAASDAAQWTQVQATDVVREFFRWQIASDILSIGISLFVWVGLWIAFRKSAYAKNVSESREYGKGTIDMSDASFLHGMNIAFGTALPSILIPIIVIVNVVDLVKIYVAPKLYLIEYAASLIKNHH